MAGPDKSELLAVLPQATRASLLFKWDLFQYLESQACS